MRVSAADKRPARTLAGESCECCRIEEARGPSSSYHVEQLNALQSGGSDERGKLILAGDPSNSVKEPELSGSRATTLFNQRTQPWPEQLRVEAGRLPGLSAAAHMPVFLLQMNSGTRRAASGCRWRTSLPEAV